MYTFHSKRCNIVISASHYVLNRNWSLVTGEVRVSLGAREYLISEGIMLHD